MTTPLAERLLASLVAIDAASSGSDLAAIARLEEALDRRGVALRRIPSPDGAKANLHARIGHEVDPRTRAGLLPGLVDEFCP